MPILDYGDYAYSSEDDNQIVSQHGIGKSPEDQIDGRDLEEDNSDRTSHHTSDEDEDSTHATDVDEYTSFSTDYERYQYDQLRWDGIQNPRKYKIAKKEKGEDQKKGKGRKEDKSQSTTKSGKQDTPKALPKSRRKGKNKAEAPLEPTVDIPKEGEIHFDNRGDLWYSYKKGDIYISDFARKRGSGNYDITCFNEVEEHWGLQRPHYAPVMFEWERLNRKDPTYQLDNLYYKDLLVIDYWRTPVRNFREIPLVISSAFEGGYMEPATRIHSEMAYEDFRARMPPFVETIKEEKIKIKALSKASTLSGRSRHFREDAGAISWDKREGSDNIKAYIKDIVKPVNNSTQGSRDLTKDEVKKLRLMNYGTKPGRSKQGTSEESKQRYKADIEKAAGLAAAIDLSQDVQELEAENESMTLAEGDDREPNDESGKMDHIDMNDYNDLYEDEEDQFLNEFMASVEDNSHQEDESMVADVRDAAPPRFVFRRTEAPFLQAITEEEALMHPLVDISDPRNHIPKFSNEVDAIRDALKVTVDHFKEIVGVEPVVYEGSNYISEYCSIQDQMDELFLYEAIALRRLGRWEGTIFDWERAEVEDDPCIGRQQLF